MRRTPCFYCQPGEEQQQDDAQHDLLLFGQVLHRAVFDLVCWLASPILTGKLLIWKHKDGSPMGHKRKKPRPVSRAGLLTQTPNVRNLLDGILRQTAGRTLSRIPATTGRGARCFNIMLKSYSAQLLSAGWRFRCIELRSLPAQLLHFPKNIFKEREKLVARQNSIDIVRPPFRGPEEDST